MTNLVINVPSEYISLGLVMQSALEQASKGKGRERHASEGESYEDQIICEVARRVGLGYPLGQAVKKIYESRRIGGNAGVQELLGALNYVAAAVIVMREGLEPAPKAEGGCFQNGNDHSPEASAEPDFKPGDKVQFCQFPHADVWFDGIVERVEGGHCFIRRSNGVEVSAPKRLIRRPCAEGCEKPKFKAGEKVQIRVTLPSVSDRIWVDGTYARYDRGCAFPHAVYNDAGHEENVQEEDIRPAPKAEGCEELVEKDAPLCGERCEEFIPGLGTCESCRHAREQDAPQTKEELMQRIVDCNPSVYPRTPTGEELAELAEEVTHE